MTPEAQAARDAIMIWILSSTTSILAAAVLFFLAYFFKKLNRVEGIAYEALHAARGVAGDHGDFKGNFKSIFDKLEKLGDIIHKVDKTVAVIDAKIEKEKEGS